ncbi:MAG: hypothetical protein PHN44_02430, partial [Candidatus Marinimicrobia bacterium]|nr:hypothetical protein [Candidatus Neomarinimicrobiota bacterium]MDD5061122.1 hypothetical protein [Candidatus Neomarinimicrobiota bacterium]
MERKIMKYFNWLSVMILIFYSSNKSFCTESYLIKSPNQKIAVNFHLTTDGEPVYSVLHSGS